MRPERSVTTIAPPQAARASDVTDAELSGLDHLEMETAPTRSILARLASAAWPKFAAAGLAVLLWQLVVSVGWKEEYLLPGPRAVSGRLLDDLATFDLWAAIGRTLVRGLTGFAMSIVIGGAIGLGVVASRTVRSAIGALITGLQTMPSIAWFPLAILLLGLSESAIMFVVVLGAAPSIANGVVSGADGMPPIYRRLGRSMGASPLSMYRDFVVPAAMPSVVGGLKQGWAFAWRSLMAGELLVVIPGTQTIGSRLQFAREFSDAEGVIASMIVILGIGIAMDALVFSRIERRVFARRGLGPR